MGADTAVADVGVETTQVDTSAADAAAQTAIDAAFESPSPAEPAASAEPAPAAALETPAPGADTPASEPAPADATAPASETDAPPVDRTVELFNKLEKLMGAAGQAAPQTPAAPAAPAEPVAAAPVAPAPVAPVAGMEDFSDIIKGAEEFGGKELVDGFAKPLVAKLAATREADRKAIRDDVMKELAPVLQMSRMMEHVRAAEVRKVVDDFASKHPTIYGKDASERAKNPALLEDIVRGSGFQRYFGEMGESLSDADAMAMAHAIRTKQQTPSAARSQIRQEMQTRSNKRASVPASSGTPDAAGDAAALAAIDKFF